MYKKTDSTGYNRGRLLALCLAVASPSFAASVKGTSPTGNAVDVEITKTPKLKYPRRAERLGVEGYVVVGFDLSDEGELVDLRVIESQPRLMFDKSALKFVEGMRFEVPEEDGRQITTSDIKFRVQFQLQN
jgi:protein TonB